jgi:hypothetical protein
MEICCKSVLLSYTSQGRGQVLCLAKIVQNKIVETLRSMAGKWFGAFTTLVDQSTFLLCS